MSVKKFLGNSTIYSFKYSKIVPIVALFECVSHRFSYFPYLLYISYGSTYEIITETSCFTISEINPRISSCLVIETNEYIFSTTVEVLPKNNIGMKMHFVAKNTFVRVYILGLSLFSAHGETSPPALSSVETVLDRFFIKRAQSAHEMNNEVSYYLPSHGTNSIPIWSGLNSLAPKVADKFSQFEAPASDAG